MDAVSGLLSFLFVVVLVLEIRLRKVEKRVDRLHRYAQSTSFGEYGQKKQIPSKWWPFK